MTKHHSDEMRPGIPNDVKKQAHYTVPVSTFKKDDLGDDLRKLTFS